LPDDDPAPQCGDSGGGLHVDGERPDPRRHRRARHAAGGRGQRCLLGTDRPLCVCSLRVPHSRALRHDRYRGARPHAWGCALMHTYQIVVLVPYVSALVLAAIPGYRVGSIVNVLASAVTFAAGLWLIGDERTVGPYAIVDEFNIVFIAINTLVGFTTSIFSASYISHE